MFEINIRVSASAQHVPYLFGNRLARFRRIVPLTEPEISKIPRENSRDLQLFRLRQTKRHTVLSELVVNRIGQPGRVPEFKREPNIAGQQRKVRRQPCHVELESRRELEQ